MLGTDVKPIPSLSARHGVYVRDRLLDVGADPEEIFAAAGFTLPDDPNKHLPIPVATFAAVLEIAAESVGDPYFALHTAEHFHYESAGIMTLTILAAPTVGKALEVLHRYDKYVDGGVDIDLNPTTDGVAVNFRSLDVPANQYPQLNEYWPALTLQLVRTSTKARHKPLHVGFVHANTRDKQTPQAFFGTHIAYDQSANSIEFSSELLSLPQATAHPLLFGILSKALQSLFQQPAEQHGFSSAVMREIVKHPSMEHVSIETVAHGLSLSPRTLRRRLSAEGLSFNQTKRFIRERRARYLLTSTSMSLADVADELGYSETSAFSRAFRGWTGTSPQNYRRSYSSG